MLLPYRSAFATAAIALFAALPWPAAHAAGPGWDGVHDRDLSGWELHLSPYTYHYHYDPNHTNVYLAGLTKLNENGWMVGGAAFQNSFGQPCVYAFGGRKYVEPWGWDRVYWSWTAGIIYGYKPPYEHKVPLNHNGFSPGFIPSMGYQLTPKVSAEVSLLGTAGVTFSVVFKL
jgi:hypothetical protein